MKNRFAELIVCMLVTAFMLSANANARKDSGSDDPNETLKFRHFSYIDHQVTGLEVFNFLMPVDW